MRSGDLFVFKGVLFICVGLTMLFACRPAGGDNGIHLDLIQMPEGFKIELYADNDTFPKDKSHGWKYIAFGPDDRLYVPVGAPCNICEEMDQRYASIMRMAPDGSQLEIYTHGVRNTVGFDWHPQTGDLWFTNNGRDWMGDDLPPDSLHHAPQQGMHFGFPYCHAGDVPDPKYGHKRSCDEFSTPALKLGAPGGCSDFKRRLAAGL